MCSLLYFLVWPMSEQQGKTNQSRFYNEKASTYVICVGIAYQTFLASS